MANQPEYNRILTEDGFSGRFRRAGKARVLRDDSDRILGSVGQAGLYALGGDKIAELKSHRTRETEDGKEIREAEYISDTRSFRLLGDDLYEVTKSGALTPLGHIERKQRNIARITVLSILTAFLVATVILLALVNLPMSETERPIVDIRDNNGSWEAQSVVAVFDGEIRPGSSGEYGFVVNNPHNIEMAYAFSIVPQYEGVAIEEFPITFRLKMNNVLLESDDWLTADNLDFSDMIILGGTKQSFTLQWQWAFDGGNDENDTVIGADGGKISMVLRLTAQAR